MMRICIPNAEKVREYAKRFLQGHWDVSRSWIGKEEVWEIFLLSGRRMGFRSQQNGTAIPRNWSPCVETHQCSGSRNPKEKIGRETIHFNGDSNKHRTLVPNLTFCKSAQYLRSSGELGVNNLAWQRKRRDESICLWTKKCWQVYHPKKYNFWYLIRQWHLETVCVKTFWASKHCPAECGSHSFVKQLTFNIVLGSIVPLCREYTFSRAHPESRVYAAILGRTIIGPVNEVRIVKILEGYGLDISTISTLNPTETSHVVISWETERFCGWNQWPQKGAQIQ